MRYECNESTDVHTLQADSLDDFAADAAARIDGKGWASNSLGTSLDDLQDKRTHSLARAVEMARTGWPEGTARILSGLSERAPEAPDTAPSWEYDMAGAVPDVGAYCAGIPEHMASPAGSDRDGATRVPRLAVLGVYSWKVPAELVENYAVALASHVRAIQADGRGVDVEWINVAKGEPPRGQARVITRVPIADAERPLDLDRVAFAFHPSMLRRLWFATMEQREELNFLTGAYGSVERNPGPDLLPDVDAVIPSPQTAFDIGLSGTEEIADWMGEYLESGGVIVRDSAAAAA